MIGYLVADQEDTLITEQTVSNGKARYANADDTREAGLSCKQTTAMRLIFGPLAPS